MDNLSRSIWSVYGEGSPIKSSLFIHLQHNLPDVNDCAWFLLSTELHRISLIDSTNSRTDIRVALCLPNLINLVKSFHANSFTSYWNWHYAYRVMPLQRIYLSGRRRVNKTRHVTVNTNYCPLRTLWLGRWFREQNRPIWILPIGLNAIPP
jgi:hypothetical protein